MTRQTLFPHQSIGARWLTERPYALLCDDPGLGKTATAIVALKRLLLRRVLIVCPAIARPNWAREWERWNHRTPPPTVLKALDDAPPANGPVVCSYERVSYDYDKETKILASLQGPWDLVIVDEAHMIKGYGAARTHAVLGEGGLIRHTQRLWALTGTPAPNHAGELWVWLHVFGATTQTEEEWVGAYCTSRYDPQRRKHFVTGTRVSAIDDIRQTLKESDVVLRRKKEDELDLPPLIWETMVVPYTEPDFSSSSEMISYTSEVRRPALLTKLEAQESLLRKAFGEAERPNPEHAEIAELRVIEGLANSLPELRKWTGLSKAPAVADLVASEIKAGAYSKVVIFAVHIDTVECILFRMRNIHKLSAGAIYGGTTPNARQRFVDKFQQEDDELQVLVCNITAAGTAITLTAAHQVVFVEMSWTPAENSQAAQRCHRIGATRTVTARVAVLEDSIDVAVGEVLARKASQISRIFDQGDLRYPQETTTISNAEDTGTDLY